MPINTIVPIYFSRQIGRNSHICQDEHCINKRLYKRVGIRKFCSQFLVKVCLAVSNQITILVGTELVRKWD